MSILVRKSPALVMAAFDALPSRVRQALAEADFAYDPDWVAERLKRSRRQKQLVERIRARTARRCPQPATGGAEPDTGGAGI